MLHRVILGGGSSIIFNLKNIRQIYVANEKPPNKSKFFVYNHTDPKEFTPVYYDSPEVMDAELSYLLKAMEKSLKNNDDI